jgi:hypothetical protein
MLIEWHIYWILDLQESEWTKISFWVSERKNGHDFTVGVLLGL